MSQEKAKCASNNMKRVKATQTAPSLLEGRETESSKRFLRRIPSEVETRDKMKF